MKPTAQNIVLGAGYVYFDPEDESGNLTGERYIGDTPGFTLAVAAETLQVFTSDGPIAELAEEFATQVTRTANITCQNMSSENLALFLIGAASTVSQSDTPVTGEEIDGVIQGRWYQLGASASNPVGARSVSSVTVEDALENPFTAGVDYELDAALGRLYIIPGGGISDDTDLVVDYTPAQVSFDQITSDNLGAKKGALRYIAANTGGVNRDMYIPKVTLTPSGELAMKSRTEVQQMTFAAGVGTRGALPQVYVNGRPA